MAASPVEVSSVAFSPDGNMLASGAENGIITIWDVQTGSELDTLSGHEGGVWGVDFDGTSIASASEDNTIKLWDIENKRVQLELKGHTEEVSSVVFSPNGYILASASGDKTVILWDRESGQKLHTLNGTQ